MAIITEEKVSLSVKATMNLLIQLIQDDENREILQTDLRAMDILLLNMTAFFPFGREEDLEKLQTWMQLLHNSLEQAQSIHRFEPGKRQGCLDCLMCNPGKLSKEIKVWKALFSCIFQGLEEDFWKFYRARREQESLSTDEELELLRRVTFEDSPVSIDIKEYATNNADECKCFPLAITLLAAAVMGKIRVDEWKLSSLPSIKNTDPNTPHPRFSAELYQRIRYWNDRLHNSSVKNCFLYCAMYRKDAEISVEDLLQYWIAEGFFQSKQESIGRVYLNLFVHRFLLQYVTYKKIENVWERPKWERVRVPHVIRDAVIYIAEEEDNCLFKADQCLQNFPTIGNEDCKRISLRNNGIETLPTEFRCPKLVSLILSSNSISVVPSGFLDSLTSLKVLDLSSNSRISSIPPSVGKLKQLGLLRLSWLSKIKDLPQEICHLSSLQFLDLSNCHSLESLPSDIGKLKNLHYLNLERCNRLTIPDGISKLSSLSTLDAEDVSLDIRKLKELGNLTRLRISSSSRQMEVGIMATWLEMRHLWLHLSGNNLPDDMQNMKKLQSFIMWYYEGFSLPDYTCRFKHLESIALYFCPGLRELSPLEQLPNLKFLKLVDADNLQQLGIGNSSGFLMLEELVLQNLPKLESITGASNSAVWNETTLPRFCMLKIWECPVLKTLPVGMQKLLKLNTLLGKNTWWQNLIWEDDSMRIHLQKLFRDWDPRDNQRGSF